MIVTDKVIDHYERPRNVGSFDKSDTDVGTGMVGAPVCGDVMKIQIKIKNNMITDTRFKTYGCGAAIATSSWLTERLKGISLTQAMHISSHEIAEKLHLPSAKMHCSILSEDAFKTAIKDYQHKQKILNNKE